MMQATLKAPSLPVLRGSFKVVCLKAAKESLDHIDCSNRYLGKQNQRKQIRNDTQIYTEELYNARTTHTAHRTSHFTSRIRFQHDLQF